MFRALLCSSSGGQNCIIQHLVSSHPVGGRPVHKIFFYNKFIIWLHVSSTVVLIIRRSKLYYTAPGRVTPCRWPSGAQNLFYNKFIIWLYMFRALLCSSSEGHNCIIQHLVSSHPV